MTRYTRTNIDQRRSITHLAHSLNSTVTLIVLLCSVFGACDSTESSAESDAGNTTVEDTVMDVVSTADTQMADNGSGDNETPLDTGTSEPDILPICDLTAIDEAFRITTALWVSPTDTGGVFSDFMNDQLTTALGSDFVWVLRVKEFTDGSSQIEIGNGQLQGPVLLFDGTPTKLAANIFECSIKGGPEVGTPKVLITPDVTLGVRELTMVLTVSPDHTKVTGQIRGHILRTDAQKLMLKLPAGSPKSMDDLLTQLGATPTVDPDGDDVYNAWDLTLELAAERP